MAPAVEEKHEVLECHARFGVLDVERPGNVDHPRVVEDQDEEREDGHVEA